MLTPRPDKSYVHRHTVTLEETNLVGNVYFTNYLRWQGHCRERFLADHAPSVFGALGDGLTLVTLSCHCDYFAELFAGDTVEVRMTLQGLESDRVVMGFDYYRDCGPLPELVARGSQTVAAVRRAASGATPAGVPEELVRALRPYERKPV